MPISVECTGCSSTFFAPDQWGGRTAKCPKCGGKVQIHAAPPPTPPAPAAKSPAPSKPKSSSPEKSSTEKSSAVKTSADKSNTTKSKNADAAAPAKPPLIGHGMRRVLVILGVVAAILYAMNELGRMMTRPQYGSGSDSGQKFGYFKNADPNDPEVQKQFEALLEAEAKHNAEPAPSKKPKRAEPAKAAKAQAVPSPPKRNELDPPPHRLDPFGAWPSSPSYSLPAQHKDLPPAELLQLKLGLEFRPLPSKTAQLERHWNGEQLGMSLSDFKLRYRQDEPQPGWPLMMLSNTKNIEHQFKFPWHSTLEEHWHLKAGILLARVVLPEDDRSYRKYLRSPELPLFDARMYCFIDERLCLIRYTTPRDVSREGSYPDPGNLYYGLLETPGEYAQLFGLPSENIRRWGNGQHEILHIRGAYLGDQEIILHRDVKLCAELEARRLAAEKK